MKETLKLAFIGGGLNSAVGYAHFCASQLDGRFKVVAGCFSRHKDINQSTAQNWGVERIYSDYFKLLEQEKCKVDAIVILTPTNKHFEVVIKALELNIPIICEKSLVDNSKDAHEILNLYSKDSFIAVTYNYTGYPMVRELKGLIEKGFLGKVHRIQIEMPQEGFIRLGLDGGKIQPQDWRLSDNQIPVISLDLGVHLYDMVQFLTGESPIAVLSEESTNGRFEQVKDDISCIAKYTNDLTVNMWFSKCALGNSNGLKFSLYGSKASASWTQTNPEELSIAFMDGSRKIIDRGVPAIIANQQRYNRFKVGHPSGFIEAFANLYSDIADQLLEKKKLKLQIREKYIQSLRDSVDGLIFFQNAHISHIEKKWIFFDEER